VPSAHGEKLFIPASNQAHCCLGLGEAANVVLGTGDVQHRADNLREVNPAPAQYDLAPGKFVLLIKLSNPLLKSRARESHTIVDPLAHCQP
jgi:hypothetical protein